jgi:hypothetical protein
MKLFGCRGCEAKDSEIAHLLLEVSRLHEHLDKAQARVLELAQPGSNARAVALRGPSLVRPTPPPLTAAQVIEEKEKRKREAAMGTAEGDNFPGYERPRSRPEPPDRYEVIG